MREYIILSNDEADAVKALNLPEGGRIALRQVNPYPNVKSWILVNTMEPEPESRRDYPVWLKQVAGQDTLTRLDALTRTIASEGLTERLQPVLDAFKARMDVIIAAL